MKTCNKCKIEKTEDEFASHPRQGLQSSCKVCQRCISAKWYANNKARQQRNAKRNTTRYVEGFNNWKRTMSCLLCPEYRTPCLDFHHVVQHDKEIEISIAIKTAGKRRLEAELAKCVCLCSNCHRLVHAGQLELPVPLNMISVNLTPYIAPADGAAS